jgi:hypothetical protein
VILNCNVCKVMTCKRILQLKAKPLTHVEFINCLAKYDPVYRPVYHLYLCSFIKTFIFCREEEECFVQWYEKTPLGKKIARALEMEDEVKADKEKNKMK